MNHIARIFDSMVTYGPESPVCDRMLPPRANSSPAMDLCGSWKSKMFAKMRECKDAIKNVVTFNKTPTNSGNVASNGSTASMIPDIITFSTIARNFEDEEVLYDSPFSTQETERNGGSTGPFDDSSRSDSSFNCSLSSDDLLKSFLENEKRVAEQFSEEDVTTSVVKKKISAQPFLFYSEGNAEFIWSDDTEDSFTGGPLNHSQTSDIVFEIPQTNSTFCESLNDSKNTGSSNVEDSGYANHVSM